MTEIQDLDPHGTLIEPATLKIQRLLPGPIERIWSYLTESELRRKWLAAGDMTGGAGSTVELVWRNDELTDPPGRRPDGFPAERRMASRILVSEPPHRLVFTWGETGEVSFELAPAGGRVLLTVIHRRLADHSAELSVAAGWHTHLDLLAARLTGANPPPFWDGWAVLRADYERRLPG
ncbi:SRPBCC family protein [Zavarzinia sp.]|uniref:SRPBCC family protein n=1 Tax=Zavarzinia sp. TaxID=2027920 RepID=UPI003566E758